MKIFKVIILSIFLFPVYVLAKVSPLTPEDCQKMAFSGVITKSNPVPCDRLNIVNFNYIDFSGNKNTGKVIVLDVVALQAENIFNELLLAKFPIHKALAIEHYNGDDQASMRDNNTSAFNGRKITGASSWSKHAYGAAIDINPLQNPFLGFNSNGVPYVLPENSAEQYLNRIAKRPGKMARKGMSEEVIDIFLSNGFMRWGGYWDTPIDYQHFEVGSLEFIESLLKKPLSIARMEFKEYGDNYRLCMKNVQPNNIEFTRAACVEKNIR
ncbi:D-alanyl-D-alanine carboxypeptidase [Xenorhabdus mauleonii]|uniref:D-alanyl-D-alanine carboxypeptidase n=1 Tax=Xenorhabdus mauleonii TaxID=351675 RepID=A0A1I3RHA6_9GAMM|nr:M15 family metallopeptidase [Xenorhabdus mauleonii]PHM39855.1 D-alanyl-D-alanine carboxypeptidase [Xenorhabdus mauleonii]SFJ44566.1 D-alanyl-D-alanine carboxypeptidase [Xenorhabdus mauleonii]